MKEIRMLDHSYIVDTDVFSSISDFEKLFADFLETRALIGKIISPLDGSKDRRTIFITRKPDSAMIEQQPNPVGRPQTLKGKIRELSDRKLRKPAINFMKGRK